MPIIRTTPSDRTAFLRVNATSLPLVAPNLRRPASYGYVPRQVIAPITRASEAAKGASPSTSVLATPVFVGYQFATGRVVPRSPDV